jgi:ribosomal protein L37E
MLRLREPGGRGTVKVLLQTPDYVEQKPLTPHDDGLDLWQANPGVTEMSVAKQQHSYQCDQCGSPNIVALSVLYEQGKRKYSSPMCRRCGKLFHIPS